MSRAAWLWVAAAGAFALGFTWLNRGEFLVIRLGVLTWYRAPVAPVLLGTFLLGMATMVVASRAVEARRRPTRRALDEP